MIYLLYGEDRYLLNNYVKKIKKQYDNLVAGINYIQIDETNLDNLISDIETPAFGLDKKLIIAKNTGLFGKKSPNLKLYEDFFESFDFEEADVVFIEENVEKNSLYKILEKKKATITDFKEKSTFEIVNEVQRICSLYKVKISNTTASYFVDAVGENMQLVINEIRKLIEYTGEGNEITIEAINELTIRQSESVIFDLTDSLGKKETGKAIKIFNELVANKEPEQKILIMLYNHFKKLFITQLSDNYTISDNLGLKPTQKFLIRKYQSQASCFTKEEILKILERFIYLDEASKLGNIDIKIGIESVIMSI